MSNDTKILSIQEVVYRDDLYPRIKPDAALVQRYSENLDVLPPIEVNQHNILIDGFHRWTAHRKANAENIQAIVTPTESEAELFALAIRRNAAHGMQMNEQDKRKVAIRLYAAGTGLSKAEIADTLSVSQRSVTSYLSDVDKQLREERKEKIFNLWMECYTTEEIAAATNVTSMTISRETELSNIMEGLPNSYKVAANFQDADFTPPLFNVWTVRAIARRMGYRRGWGQFPVALHHLRRRGYVDFVDFKDGSIGTLRYTEPEMYE